MVMFYLQKKRVLRGKQLSIDGDHVASVETKRVDKPPSRPKMD